MFTSFLCLSLTKYKGSGTALGQAPPTRRPSARHKCVAISGFRSLPPPSQCFSPPPSYFFLQPSTDVEHCSFRCGYVVLVESSTCCLGEPAASFSFS